MSNMDTNRNNAKAKDQHSANKLEVNQSRNKFHQEELSELDFNFDAAAAQQNDFVEKSRKTGSKQPVSERTAWN